VRKNRRLGIRLTTEELNMDKDTNFNNKFEHEKFVCQNGPKEYE